MGSDIKRCLRPVHQCLHSLPLCIYITPYAYIQLQKKMIRKTHKKNFKITKKKLSEVGTQRWLHHLRGGLLHPPAKYAKYAYQLNCTLHISIYIQSHSHCLIDWIPNKLYLTSEPSSSVHSFIHRSLVFIRSFTGVHSLILTHSNSVPSRGYSY